MSVDYQGTLAAALRTVPEGVVAFDIDVDALAVLDIDSGAVGAGKRKAVKGDGSID